MRLGGAPNMLYMINAPPRPRLEVRPPGPPCVFLFLRFGVRKAFIFRAFSSFSRLGIRKAFTFLVFSRFLPFGIRKAFIFL